YVVVPADQVLPVPSRLTLEQAAAVPEAYLTAHDALFTQARAQRGERVLVHAIASGVGVALLQLGHAFELEIIGTSRTQWKLDRMRALGLRHALRAGGDDLEEDVMAAAGGTGLDVVIDLVGGDYLGLNVRVLRTRGRLVIVGLVGGRTAELDMGAVLSKRLHLIGTAMRSRAPAEKAAVARLFREHALALFDDGPLEPVIDDVLPLADAARA